MLDFININNESVERLSKSNQKYAHLNDVYLKCLIPEKYNEIYVYRSYCGAIVFPFCVREFNGNMDIYTPYGYNGLVVDNYARDCDSVITEITKWGNGQGFIAGYIQLSLYQQESNWDNLITPHNTIYLVDLRQGIENVYSGISKNIKAKLKEADKTEFQIIENKSEIEGIIFNLYKETYQRVSASNVYQFDESTLRKIINQPSTHVFAASTNGVIQAVSIFIHYEGISEYFLNCSTEQGRLYSAQLLVKELENACRLGLEYLNMGGGVSAGDGLSVFKKRFGGEEHGLRALRLIFNQSGYHELAKGKESSGFFPAYYAQ